MPNSIVETREPGAGDSVFLDQDLLGECPYWDAKREVLTRVDVYGGDIVTCDPVTGTQKRLHLGGPLSFAVPRSAGGFVVGRGTEILLLDADGTLVSLLELGPELVENRINDAVCDPSGRLWAGTMSAKRPRELGTGEAALYRIDPDGGHERVLGDLTLSNGIDWLDDGNTLLHIDSDAHRIDKHDIDATTGRLSHRRTFVECDPSLGLPDGMTVDSEDGVWLAFFGGSQVRHYDRSGTEDIRYRLPVSCPASVALGGRDLLDLFVTTSRHRLTPAEALEQPLAGSLLRLRATVAGRLPSPFAG